MEKTNHDLFEELFRQNERRIHYHIHRLNIQDPHQEYYQEGLVAMWNAYENYQPDKGPMATYFNYMIRNRMIDCMRKQNREVEKTARYAQEFRIHIDDGNAYRSQGLSYPIVRNNSHTEGSDAAFWQKVRHNLSDNQWKWVCGSILEGKPIRVIAEEQGVTAEAVKSWGKTARKKLRKMDAVIDKRVQDENGFSDGDTES